MDIKESWKDFREKPFKEAMRIIRIPLIAFAGIVFLNWVNTSGFTGWSSSILNNVTEAFIGYALLWLGDRLFCHTRAHKLKEAANKPDATDEDKLAYRDREKTRLLAVGLMLLGVFASAG